MLVARRTEEDRVIEQFNTEGKSRLYDDTDFLPIRQSLYTNPAEVPEYDGDVFHRICWLRPHAINSFPEYLHESTDIGNLSCIQGTLPDENLIGTLMAVATYSKQDLLEQIISSNPDDFKKYGIYTCQFYVEGQWVEVVTDTNLPCLRDEQTGESFLVYTHSPSKRDLWLSFIEKAYAKAVGNYEAIQKVQISEALLHLTGGSVQQITLKEKMSHEIGKGVSLYSHIEKLIRSNALLLLLSHDSYSGGGYGNTNRIVKSATVSTLLESASTEKLTPETVEENEEEVVVDETDYDCFCTERIYSIITCYQYHNNNVRGDHAEEDIELVLLHNPWSEDKVWEGPWSNNSIEWQTYPHILHQIEDMEDMPWSLKDPKRYFWMPTKVLFKCFHTLHSCQLFDAKQYHSYHVNDEWKEKKCGGGISLIRPKQDIVKEYNESKTLSNLKACPSVVKDGDLSWFNNPQVRVIVEKPSVLFVSLLPTTNGEEAQSHPMQLTITSMPITSPFADQKHLWESSLVDVVAISKLDTKLRGQEASLWSIPLDPAKVYHVVCHTQKHGLNGSFILRLFSTQAIIVEKVPELFTKVIHGHWTKTNDNDTTGGPLTIKKETGTKANPKWCQNPQYHLEPVNTFSKEDFYLKIVVHRYDREQHSTKTGSVKMNASTKNKVLDMKGNGVSGNNGTGSESNVGLLVCKAHSLEQLKLDSAKNRNQPKENFLGEIMVSKTSTLRKPFSSGTSSRPHQQPNHPGSALPRVEIQKTIMRQISMEKECFYAVTSGISRGDTTVFFPKMPRTWMPDGIMVIPFLNEKNTKANYDIEIYCSEPVKITHLPETYSRCLAGEWKENICGGCHLLPSWKKNPKYILKLRNSTYGVPTNVRVSLSRYGNKWVNMCKNDTVGCMIGFYIFKQKSNETQSHSQSHYQLQQQQQQQQQQQSTLFSATQQPISLSPNSTLIYESDFIPSEEVVTEATFQLGPLDADEVYVLMVATFAADKHGSFILTVNAERDFTLKLEKSGV